MIGKSNPHARRLRRDATEAERRLWAALRNRQLAGLKFRRQVTIGPYIADFACLECRLIVEADGGQHGSEVDADRTLFLEERGYQVLRFWNNAVLENLEGVMISIQAEAEKRKKNPSPNPLPQAGEGK